MTVQGVKRHTKVNIRYKWQRRWDSWESRRDFYLSKPFLKSNPRLGDTITKLYKQMLQLRNG